MKTVQQISNNTLRSILIILLAGILLLPACMETSSPSDNNEREITVLVYNSSSGIKSGKTPIRGAEVRVFQGATNNPLRTYTNSKGAAKFILKVPVAGKNYNFTATYNNRSQSKNSTLICVDTTLIFIFDTTQVKELNCDELDRMETLVFTDGNGSSQLKLNTPSNISRYEKCSAGLYNSGTQAIVMTLPTVRQPFRRESVLLDGSPATIEHNQVTIKPGETLTMCFSVSTKELGEFSQTLSMPLECVDGRHGTYRITLLAVVVAPTCDCDEFADGFNFILTDRVEVGKSKDVKQVIFTNTSPCNVSVNRISFNGNKGWTILAPKFPVTVNAGRTLEITARFKALYSGTHYDTLSLELTPEGTDNKCSYYVNFEGDGCSSSCPFISLDGFIFDQYSSAPLIDTISDRTDKRVFFSMSNAEPPINTTVSKMYYFMNPDSACTEIKLNVSLSYQRNDIYSPKYFTVSPQELSLAPGEVGVVQVTFVSPDIEELDKIVAARGNTGRTADSAFNVYLQVNSPHCSQRINATTVVTVFPDISPIINLRAYSQRTRLAPEPENEVYYFGANARTILKGRGNTPGAYPPQKGQIWIDVIDTLPTATPPQQPILKSISGTLGMKIWRTSMLESDFTNVGATYMAFVSDPSYSTGYTAGPLTNLAPGNVVAFKINRYMYSLVYIRSIYNGTENNTNLQSGIEFRAIYPIYIP